MSMQYDAPRPFATGEQLVGDDVEEVFERSEIKAQRVTPTTLPGVPPPQPFPALGTDNQSILGPAGLSGGHAGHGQ